VPESIDHIVYESKLRNWEHRASVRVKPHRELPTDAGIGLLYFPPELVPAATHPHISRRGPGAVTRVLVHALFAYLDFTVELEQNSVNRVCAAISQRRTGLRLPDLMRRDAFKIYTDEAWHAQFSDDLEEQVARATGIQPIDEPPALRRRLAALSAGTVLTPSLTAIVFVIVSETLISGVLADIPRDSRVTKAVRDIISDHAIDEGVHHAYFSSLLEYVWPQLSAGQQLAASLLLPDLIKAFLEPDLKRLAVTLYDVGLSEQEVGEVLSDCYDEASVQKDVAANARATLRYFSQVGIFDEPRVIEAFSAARLNWFR
jgi:P-aminobenzoate N-oxygenase AurF